MTKMIFVMCLTLFATSAFAKITVGTVDVQKILISVKQGKAVKAKLQKVFDKKQGELKKLEEQIKKGQEKFQKDSLVLSDKAKVQKQQELQKLYAEFQGKTLQYQKEIQKLENEMKKPILGKIRDIIEVVSKNAKVDVTFEVSTTPVLYSQAQKDLTETVIQAYDKKHPK